MSEMAKYAAGSNNMNSSVLSSRDFISSVNMLTAYNNNFLQDQKVSTNTIKKETLATELSAAAFQGTLRATTNNRYAKVAEMVDKLPKLVEYITKCQQRTNTVDKARNPSDGRPTLRRRGARTITPVTGPVPSSEEL